MKKIFKYIAPLLAGLLVLIAVIYAGEEVQLISSNDKILPGVMIKDIDIGGLSKQQAVEKILAVQDKMLKIPVTITYQNQAWSLPLKQVGLQIDIENTLHRAINIGREGSFIERWKFRQRVAKEGYVLQPVVKVNKDLLSKVVNNLAGHLNVAPQSATLSIDEHDQVVITPSKSGKRIDVEQLQQNLQKELLVGKHIILPLPVVEIKPEYITANIQDMGITGLLASYTTKFDPQIVNRSYNIRVAANALDGLIITPGEEVSFNEVVGPRSSEAGYKSAGVIVNNELVEGLGGGVCQVSTTLYNAILLAGLEVVDRRNHSLPISYVPIGRDATVVYGVVDFKFQNNSGRCLYLKTEVKSGQLTVKIFGDANKKQKVIVNSWVEQVLEPKIVYEEDDNLKKGQQVVKQEGSKGYIVNAERVVIKNGVIIKNEKLPVSRYNPVDKVIAVGTAEPEPAITPPDDIDIDKLTLDDVNDNE